jgi:hypothetical protein
VGNEPEYSLKLECFVGFRPNLLKTSQGLEDGFAGRLSRRKDEQRDGTRTTNSGRVSAHD